MIPTAATWAAERAAALRDRLAEPPTLRPARETIARALEDAGLAVERLQRDDPLLAGADGVLDRQMQAIWIRDDLPPRGEAFLLAHEIGHWHLHCRLCTHADLVEDLDASGFDGPVTMQEADGYSPVQRQEIEANAFAAELVAPCAVVCQAYIGGLRLGVLADKLGLTERVVGRQLLLAILEAAGSNPMASAESGSAPELDDVQMAAAEAPNGPTVVAAGPGSGKTRTLTRRVLYLLEQGVPPDRILALTFSRNAAEELRERLRRADPELAVEVGVFTLHGFGLELLRRYGDAVGLSPNPTVCDRAMSLMLLEQIVARGSAGFWEYLDAPTRPLPGVLDLILRCKEAGMSPSALRCGDEHRQHAANLYALYERALDAADAVDFADLLMLSADLLEAHPEIRKSLPDHVLVDELQDMDTPSLNLIRLIAGNGHGLWAVGDPLQAIYAFRGSDASGDADGLTACVGASEARTLAVNYRSAPEVTQFVAAMGRHLGLDGVQSPRSARSGVSGRVILARAAHDVAEADGIARTIEAAKTAGIPYGRQAVLCRTNQLARTMADMLRQRGLPVNGPVTTLERASVRQALCSLAEAVGMSMPGLDPNADRVSVEDLVPAGTVSEMLLRYLFGRSGVARQLTHCDAAMDRAALMWLWGRAESISARLGELPLREQVAALLEDVRRCVALGEDRLKADGAWRGEAVHVITIHASKGLEFDAVYIPRLNADVFPPKYRRYILQTEISGLEPEGAEARVLYVAASRARLWVVLSCSRRVGGRRALPSLYLDAIELAIHDARGTEQSWDAESAAATSARPALPDTGPGVWSLSELNDYDRCPHRYCLQSRHGRAVSTYARFVGAMRQALRTLHGSGSSIGASAISEAMAVWYDTMQDLTDDEAWRELYARRAEDMLGFMWNDARFRASELFVPMEFALPHGTLALCADSVHCDGDGTIAVERYVYRARRTNAPDSHGTAALWRACHEAWPGRTITMAIRYLGSSDVETWVPPRDNGARALAHYDGLMRAIRTRPFEPRPADHCAWCAFLMVCKHNGTDDEAQRWAPGKE